MAQPEARGIYRLFGAVLAVLASALVLPRLVAGRSEGFAAGAAAALTVLVLGGLATILSLVLFVRTVQRMRSLPLLARLAGLLPAPVLLVAGTVLWLGLRY